MPAVEGGPRKCKITDHRKQIEGDGRGALCGAGNGVVRSSRMVSPGGLRVECR